MSVSELLVQKYLKEIEGQEWYPPLSNARPFLQVNDWNTRKYFDEYYDDTLPFPLLFISKKGQGLFYFPATKVHALAKEVFVKYWHNPSIQDDVSMKYGKLDSRVNEVYEKYAVRDEMHEVTKEEMLSDLGVAVNATWSLNALAFFSIYFDQELAEKFLVSVASDISRDRLNELWGFLSTPIHDSFDVRHKKIFLRAKRDGASLDQLAKNLRFFEAAYHKVSELKEVKDIFSQKYEKWLDASVSAQELESENEVSNSKVKIWKTKLEDFSKEEQKLAKYFQWIIALRDERKDALGKMLVIAHIIGSRLFDEAGIPRELLYFAPMYEWTSGMKKLCEKISLFEKIERDVVVLVHWSGEREVAFGEADKTLEILQPSMQDEVTLTKAIKGQVGSPGKIQGKVCIVLNASKFDHFKDGDILVTGMTRPEFVPLMKRASAIITDEGGITCHATIVARELKKPCIIGTKIATRVLHDGDLVEVNAERGIVTILERAELS